MIFDSFVVRNPLGKKRPFSRKTAKDVNYTSNRWRRTKRRARGYKQVRIFRKDGLAKSK
jgi:hypothetical protein